MQDSRLALFPWIVRELDDLTQHLHRERKSRRTMQAYLSWTRRYLEYRHRRWGERADPRLARAGEVGTFLRHLADEEQMQSSSQSQALHALLFYHRHGLGVELSEEDRIAIPRPERLPAILEPDEVERIFEHLHDWPSRLIAGLIYGAGLRLAEAVGLRVDELDFENRTIRADLGGRRERTTLMPEPCVPALELWQWEAMDDRREFLFPSADWQKEKRKSDARRDHLDPRTVERSFAKAVRAAGLEEKVRCETLRHSFAVRLLQDGVDPTTVSRLLGHRSTKPLRKYLRLLGRELPRVVSPLEALDIDPYLADLSDLPGRTDT